ncbi:MAG: ribonuclease R [Pseudomonadota bacterium]
MKKKKSRVEKKRSAGADFRAADDSNVPVPSRSQIIAVLEDEARPMPLPEIFQHFGLDSGQQHDAIRARIDRLKAQGTVMQDRRGRLLLPEKIDLVRGKVLGHTNGFGFVVPDDGGDDLYLHNRQMRRALHGDRVLAKVRSTDRKGRKEGEIIEVMVDSNRTIVGRYLFESGVGFVEPDDNRFGRDFVVPSNKRMDAEHGDIVVIKVLHHPVDHLHAVGEVVERVGKIEQHGMEVEIAIRKHELPHEWPQSVQRQVDRLDTSQSAIKPGRSRHDLRSMPLVTIDGSDARDFDDAVYCSAEPDGWRLLVAIADVSHYVKAGSALDLEAIQRGNSVYFPDRVIPMLPEVLSNGVCSLNPAEDRYCMVCDMRIGLRGGIRNFRFYPAIMHSHARLTYEQAAPLIDRKNVKERDSWSSIVESLDALAECHFALAKARNKTGAIEFRFSEPFFHYDHARRISKITVRERNEAHRLIESCMLAANICAARLLQKKYEDRAIYRNHLGPDDQALNDLNEFLNSLGLSLGGGAEPKAIDYARLLKSSAKKPEQLEIVQMALLRSLSQAVYETHPEGHFALSFPLYTHFTSPIRRYPDLLVHRLIKRTSGQDETIAVDPLEELAVQCSMTERRAEAATREVTAWLKADFMCEKLGETFDATVSGVREFGLFVTLNDVFVDGLVHVTELGGDYFHFDPTSLTLVGERSGARFQLGDRLRVTVARVDMKDAKIDFCLADSSAGTSKSPGKGQKKRDKANQKPPGGKAGRKKKTARSDRKKPKKKSGRS